MDEIKSVLEKLGAVTQEVNVDAVFGKPEQVGDRILIPVAELLYGIGVGAGTAPGDKVEITAGEGAPAPEDGVLEESEAAEEGAGGTASGVGGATGAKARPIAYIEIGPDGTRVQPIVDEQKVALAGILLSAWAVGWIGLVLKTIFSRRS